MVSALVVSLYLFSVIFSAYWLAVSSQKISNKKDHKLSLSDWLVVSILSLIPGVNVVFGAIGWFLVKNMLGG